jgi:hypothetical protein
MTEIPDRLVERIMSADEAARRLAAEQNVGAHDPSEHGLAADTTESPILFDIEAVVLLLQQYRDGRLVQVPPELSRVEAERMLLLGAASVRQASMPPAESQ